MADGEYANPNQESGSGDHPTTPTTWSAMLAPTTWAMDRSRAEFGAPRHHQTSRHHKLNK
jgi:hypothetical protein